MLTLTPERFGAPQNVSVLSATNVAEVHLDSALFTKRDSTAKCETHVSTIQQYAAPCIIPKWLLHPTILRGNTLMVLEEMTDPALPLL